MAKVFRPSCAVAPAWSGSGTWRSTTPKVKANASKHKAMSYARMRATEARLRREVAAWFERAAAEDTSEDAAHGDQRGAESTEVYAAQHDAPFLDEMLAQIRSNTGRQARAISADYGYLSEASLRACRRRHVAPYIATAHPRTALAPWISRRRDGGQAPSGRPAQPRSLAHAGRRTRVRPDQDRARHRRLPAPRPREGPR